MIFQAFITYLVQRLSGLIDTFSLEPKQITSHDRLILEEIILPHFAKSVSVHKVLFVGWSSFTTGQILAPK